MKKYDKLKKFIRDYYKIIIIYLILIPLFTIELNYEVYTPGGLINLNNRINIQNEKNEMGDINITYVSTKKGIIPFILLSKILPNWDIESKSNIQIENESDQEIYLRGIIDLNNINEIATYVAYKKANKEYEIKDRYFLVYFVSSDAKTNIKTGDKIIKIDDTPINTYEDLTNKLNTYEENSKIKILVERNNKQKECYANLKKINGQIRIGIYIKEMITIETNPKIEFNYKKSEMGSSGGLMSALAIYNSITKEDITKGKKIAGTGTIDMDGNVGEIAGVKYKILGAINKNADIFIVPENNYEEAKKYVKNSNIKLIKAKTFDQVLEELSSL